MKRFRGFLMVAFIFLCGLLVGGFLGLLIGSVGIFHKIVKGGPGALREVVMDRAVHELKLKPEQKVRVHQIVGETGDELTAATAEVRPKIEEIMGRNEARIRETLDEQQRRKFDLFVNEGRRRWQAAVEAHATPAPATPEQKDAPALEAPAPPTPAHPERSAADSTLGEKSVVPRGESKDP